jgi:hypothetical protein
MLTPLHIAGSGRDCRHAIAPSGGCAEGQAAAWICDCKGVWIAQDDHAIATVAAIAAWKALVMAAAAAPARIYDPIIPVVIATSKPCIAATTRAA